MVGLRKIYVGIGVGQWCSVAYGAEAAAHIAVTLDLGKNLKSYNWDLPDFFCLADSAASLCIASIRSNSSSVISLTPVSFLLHEVAENATLMSAMAVNRIFLLRWFSADVALAIKIKRKRGLAHSKMCQPGMNCL